MFRVTDKPIDLQELVRFVSDPGAGAIATFIGTTRNNNEGRNVIALDYEAYPEMAEKELARIGEDALTLIRHYFERARPASPTALGNRAVP
jgi:molybdopterin synthase catalytic subunit